MSEHCVQLRFPLSEGVDFGTREEQKDIFAFEEELEAAIEVAGVGEFDGDEFGGGSCCLYMYGLDADALWSVVEPVVKGSKYAEHATVYKRYGAVDDDDVREIEFKL